MTELLDQLQNASTWAELQSSLGDYLGLQDPAPIAVVRRAQQDSLFRYRLISARNRPDLLKFLLGDPKNAKFALAAQTEHSTRELVGKLGRSLFEWGKARLTAVDEATLKRRYSACLACDRLVDPPESTLYKLGSWKMDDRRICGACGCFVARKVRLPHEACPLPDPISPESTRWGEPLRRADPVS